MTTTPKWRRFEDLVTEIQRALAPTASIEQDVRLPGQSSGVDRQIDILIRLTTGQFTVTIVIDCKDYGRPIDVKVVEDFMGLVSDVQANKAAIVAANGFTHAAKNRAQRAGIDLLQLVDTQPHDWQTYASIPVLVDDRGIRRFSCTLSRLQTTISKQQLEDFGNLILHRLDMSPIGTIGHIVNRMWNSGKISAEQGQHSVELAPGECHILGPDGRLSGLQVVANVEVDRTLYFGNLPLVEIQGFRNAITGETHTRGFTTGDIDHATVTRTWKKVASIDELAVQPVITTVVTSWYEEGAVAFASGTP